jgi:iron-sulfur cluster assembly accessory protein
LTKENVMSDVNTKPDVVTITPTAVEKVLALIAERELEDHALRIFVAGATCSGIQYGLAFDKDPREDDTTVAVNGLKVVVDPQSLPFVQGLSIDFVETPRGAGFRLDNPDANPGALCGGGCCGR